MGTLDDVWAIQQLKHRYIRAGDIRDWALLESTLHPDVHAVYGRGLEFDNAADLVATVRRFDGSRLDAHFLHQPEIEVDGDRATGSWLLEFRTIRPSAGTFSEGFGRYTDEYIRCDDGAWRIFRTVLERTAEYAMTFADVPSFRLIEGAES